jgi:hypothetical protein
LDIEEAFDSTSNITIKQAMNRHEIPEALMHLTEHALKMTYRLCKTKGLVVNPQNTNAMTFTRKYEPEPTEPLRLKGEEIAFTSTVKYLGVFIDPKLNWKQHLIENRKKLYSSVWVCRIAMSKTWGISSRLALCMYSIILLPKLLHASVVWWPIVSRVEARNLLQILQGGYVNPKVDLWFTDRSGIHDCFGAGFYGHLYNYSEHIPMGSLSTVFSAEVMGILRCT